MSNPRAIAQVLTAASALEGAGVSLDVSNASMFVVGQVLELYPPQHGDGAPLARAGQTVRYQVDAIAGQTLVGTLNTDDYANPPQVERGWLCDGRTSAGSGGASGETIYIDGITYARTRAGFAAAFAAIAAAGGGKVVVPPGDDILWDSTSVTYSGSNLTLEWDASVTLNLPANANVIVPFIFAGTGGGLSKELSVDAATVRPYVQMVGADLDLLVAAGLVRGSIVYLYQDPLDVNEPHEARMATRVTAIDLAGDAVYLAQPPPKAYTTLRNASLAILLCGRNNRVTGIHANGSANTGGSGSALIQYRYQEGFSYDDIEGVDMPGMVINAIDMNYRTRHGSVHAVRCGFGYADGVGIDIHGDYAGATVGRWLTESCQWGIQVVGSAYSTYHNLHAHSSAKRNIEVDHSYKGRYSSIEATNSLANAGFTLSGDSHQNEFDGIIAYGNYEPGILLTAQGTGSTVTDNRLRGISAHDNNRQAGEINIGVNAGMGPANHFEGEWGGPALVNALQSGNSFSHECMFTMAFAAGDYTAATGAWNTILDAEEETTWTQQGKEMKLNGVVAASTVTLATASLRRALPNGRTAAVAARGWASVLQGATNVPAFCRVGVGATYVEILPLSLGNFTAPGADLTYVAFGIAFQVQ